MPALQALVMASVDIGEHGLNFLITAFATFVGAWVTLRVAIRQNAVTIAINDHNRVVDAWFELSRLIETAWENVSDENAIRLENSVERFTIVCDDEVAKLARSILADYKLAAKERRKYSIAAFHMSTPKTPEDQAVTAEINRLAESAMAAATEISRRLREAHSSRGQ